MGLRVHTRPMKSLATVVAVSDLPSSSSSTPLAITPSSSFCESAEQSAQGKPRKLLKFVCLKNSGTTIKNDSGKFDYYYNPLETGSNPYNNLCVDHEGGYSAELVLEDSSKKVYLPDLPTQRDDSSSAARSSAIFESSSTAVIPSAGNLASISNACSGVSINGIIRFTVSNADKPVAVTSHEVYLKCFVGEFACYVDTSKNNWRSKLNFKRHPGEKIVKPLTHPDDENLESHLLPFKSLRLELQPAGQVKYLAPGVYEFPFTFTVNLNEFPSSCRTFLGFTLYRIESQIKILNSRNKMDTVILTESVDIKRVLSTTSNTIKYESVNFEGSWNKNEFSYSIILATKMIEIGEPFKITVGIIKEFISKMILENIQISLVQSTSIPCIDYDSKKIMGTSYVKKSVYEIYHHKSTCLDQKNEDQLFEFHEIDDLVIPKDHHTISSWLRPFYCEPSHQLRRRARLKITHALSVQLRLRNCLKHDGTDALKPSIDLTFRVPILLVDRDMLDNLSLPVYKLVGSLEALCCDDPPEYAGMIPPPCYKKIA